MAILGVTVTLLLLFSSSRVPTHVLLATELLDELLELELELDVLLLDEELLLALLCGGDELSAPPPQPETSRIIQVQNIENMQNRIFIMKLHKISKCLS